MAEQDGEMTRKLRDYFEKRDDIAIAFLFGSRSGEHCRFSHTRDPVNYKKLWRPADGGMLII